MNYIGRELHKNSSRVCVLTEDGELIISYCQGRNCIY